MDQRTTATDAIRQGELTGGPVVPSFLAVVYGVYCLFKVGLQPSGWPTTYLLILGGVASMICATMYASVMFAPPGRSVGGAGRAMAGLVPCAFSLYLMAYLGAWAVWVALSYRLGFGHVAFGVLWVLLGWRMIYTLGKIRRLA